jgi:hypothetical protein
LNLLETKEPNDEKIQNFEKKVFPKNIPLSLFAFLEVDDVDFSSSEAFLNVCKYLTTPRVLKNFDFDKKMNEFRSTTNLLDFHFESIEWENFTFEMIKEHRFLLF